MIRIYEKVPMVRVNCYDIYQILHSSWGFNQLVMDIPSGYST